jgi:GTPase
MVLVDASLHPRASWEFDADIAILTHSTTIAPKYQAVIHCEIVRQAARVVAMDRERLRSGDRAPLPPAAFPSSGAAASMRNE